MTSGLLKVRNTMPYRYPKRSQYKCTKQPYHVRNWLAYETALRRRGELTLWFSEEAIQAWHPPTSGRPGGQRVYSDLAIETALTVRTVYHLGLRQAEGFLRSVSALLNLKIRIPDHSTLSRRAMTLPPVQMCPTGSDGLVHILIDSTGLKMHRGTACPAQPRNRRAWRKLHLVVDAVSAEILASELTTHQTRDSSHVPGLLCQVDGELASAAADGAYDVAPVYEAIAKHSTERSPRVVIPPRRNARVSRRPTAATNQRNHNIRWICDVGRRRWQKESGYTRRNLVETAIFRFKTIIGRRLRSRTLPSQQTEVRIACSIINTMTQLGMPESYCAA